MNRQMYDVASLPDTITVGRQTETGVMAICFGCKSWLTVWPGMQLSIWATPPRGAAYQARTHMEGNVLVWDVSDVDTAVEGNGSIEIVGTAAGQRKLFAIINTRIYRTTAQDAGISQEYLAQIVQCKNEALDEIEATATEQIERMETAAEEWLSQNPTGVSSGLPRVFIDGTIPTTKDNVLAEMRYESDNESFHAYLKIKCQGTASMNFPKKNFTVKLYSDEARKKDMFRTFSTWGHASNKYVLKANWVDHTHARNIIGARLWTEVVANRPDYSQIPRELRESPCNGAVDGFPIKVYTNGVYQGVYTWNIGKDEWMFGMDESNPNHVVVGAETNTNNVYAETPCNFRALWSGVDEEHWSVEVGENSEAVKTSLNNLIEFVMTATDSEFKANLSKYLDVQSAIDYYLFMYVNGGFDNLAKNMLLATYDLKKWYCSAYDMDIFWGCNGLANTFLQANKPCPEEYAESFSLLWERIEKLYVTELQERYAELRAKVLNFPNFVTKFERFHDCIGKELLEEDLEIYPEIPLGDENHVKQARNFMRDRLTYVDGEIQTLGTGLPGGVVYMLTKDTTFDGVDDYIDTGVKLFDSEKSWTIFLSFTGADWVNNATVFTAETPGWASGLSLYTYVSDASHLYTIGGGGNNIGGTEGLNGFAYNPAVSGAPWLDLDDADPTSVRYNIVFRWDSASDTFYYATSANGANKQSGSYTVPYRQHMFPVMLGANYVDSNGGQRRFWHGTIHKAGVWFKKLTDTDTAALLAMV